MAVHCTVQVFNQSEASQTSNSLTTLTCNILAVEASFKLNFFFTRKLLPLGIVWDHHITDSTIYLRCKIRYRKGIQIHLTSSGFTLVLPYKLYVSTGEKLSISLIPISTYEPFFFVYFTVRWKSNLGRSESNLRKYLRRNQYYVDIELINYHFLVFT